MGIEDAFLHDILAHPDDDAPRLIYADWLDEHNEPRGEFIRIQCALSQLSDEDPRRWPLEQRERELLRDHRGKWLPKSSGNASCVFRRGFVEEITLSSEDFLDGADRLFEQAPIRGLHLHSSGWGRREREFATLSQIASSHHLARLRKLGLIDFALSQSELHEFLESPTLRFLADLRLSHLAVESERPVQPLPDASLPVEIVYALSEMPFYSELRTLHLTDMALSLDALRFLAREAPLMNLRELKLKGNRLTHEAARILAEGLVLPQLDTLHLDSNLLGDSGALVIRDWPALPRLTRLGLQHNQIFSSGVEALANAPALHGLISLDLFGNIGCDAGAVALASGNWTRVQALNLRFNGIGDKGVRALAGSETLSQLARLNLTANGVTSVGARALIESPTLSRLARLDLQRNDIGEEAKQLLRDRFGPFVYC